MAGTIAAPSTGEEFRAETGFDAATQQFVWGGVRLTEAFADVHEWKPSTAYCTSYNSVRCEWLDYMFLSPTLRVEDRATDEVRVPATPLPTVEQGSDHLALAAAVSFV